MKPIFVLGAALCAFSPQIHAAPSAVKPPAVPLAKSFFDEAAVWITVSGPSSPRVAYALQKTATAIEVALEADSFGAPSPGVAVEVGLAGEKAVRLGSEQAKTRVLPGGGTRFWFAVPLASLGNSVNLRLAFAVRWLGAAGAPDVQRERFFCSDNRAPHAALPSEAAQWAAFSLEEHRRLVEAQRNRIVIEFAQPLDGKASVVIEDAVGRRVRNLVAGRSFLKGKQQIVWDGVDEDGAVAPPGSYRWRAIAHPGLKPQYQFAFADGPGSNHQTFSDATTNGEMVFLAASVSEGGHCFIGMTPDGTVKLRANPPHGQGLDKVFIAADKQYLYAAHDGQFWGQRIDRSKPNWSVDYPISLERYEIVTGRSVPFVGKNWVTLAKNSVGPGSPDKRPDRAGLSGMALLGGKLYVADWHANALHVVNPETGQKTGEIALDKSGALAAAGENLLAVSNGAVVKVSADGKTTPLIAAGAVQPTGLAFSNGEIFVSDGVAQNVKVFDESGKFLRALGKSGGPYVGTYDAQRLIHPAGLTIGPNGWLWVAENGRWTPKRIAAYDSKSGALQREYFGPTAYGAPGSGFDPLDHTRWVGQGALWQLDFAKKTASPIALLGGQEGMHFRWLRQNNRTFLISYGKATFIQELRADNTLKPLACLSSAHQLAYYHDWRPPAGFIAAYNAAYPARKYESGKTPPHGDGLLWSDANGDGEMQSDEFQFATAAESFAGAGWGHDLNDLALRVAATVGKRAVLVSMAPTGWWPGGAPQYGDVNAACKAAPPIDLKSGTQVESTVARDGTLILNSDPEMRAFKPDGSLAWRYPNRWTNVHGSHNAPLPEPGVLQGVLFFTGIAPLDESSDVMLMNGNHGRIFAMTSDGIYLDEMFRDVRVSQVNDEYMIGGECFGGTFGKSAKDGNYYYQAGGISYRIYRIDGLRQATRSGGALAVSAAQANAAEQQLNRRLTQNAAPKTASAAMLATPPTIDGRDNDWQASAIRWDRNGRFPAGARLTFDKDNLYLFYTVEDSSPWTNNGKDWQALFKTGDSVDLQIATNPAADAARSGPVPGDLRLLIAPFNGQATAVLYQHRLKNRPAPGASGSVVFQSPWRSEQVDSVRQLTSARIAVTKEGGAYRVEAAIPLAELGLAYPAGQTLRADFGVIYGDDAGQINLLRSYWSNPATMLVNDVPGEIMLTPKAWGSVKFEEAR